MHKVKFRSICWLLALIGALSVPCEAQFSASVQGVVQDPSGALIPAAKVTLRNLQTGIETETQTNTAGFYRFSSLAPGRYEVTVEAAGFRTVTIQVLLTTGQVRDLNVDLEVARAGEAISVTAEAPVLDTAESRQHLTMQQTKLRDLPLLNNSLFALLPLAPGVTGLNGAADNFNPEYFSGMSANGASPRGNTYNVDGLSVTSNITNGTLNLGVNPEAVQELTIETNTFKAEQGLGSSIVVSVTTKAGTNEWHGAANYWFTNQDMRARTSLPFIARYAPFRRNNISGALGGPLVKNKTFLFGAFEVLRQTEAATSVVTYESPQFVDWARANFPNSIGTSLLTSHPASAPVTTNPNFRDARAVLGAECGTAATANIPCDMPMLVQGTWNRSPARNGLQYNFRGDQYLRDGRDRIFGSFIRTQSDNEELNVRPTISSISDRYVNGFQANWTRTVSATLINEFGVSGNRVQGYSNRNAPWQIPAITVQGTTGIGVGFGGVFVQNNWNWRNVVTWVKGSHTLKFGGNYFWGNDYADFEPANSRPNFFFTNLVDLVRDRPFSGFGAARDPLTGELKRYRFGAKLDTIGVFAQDEWKVRPNLTLTMSLRWDDFGNPAGIRDWQYTNIFVAPGTDYRDQFREAVIRPLERQFPGRLTNNFSPRLGVAWSPGTSRKWVVRGGVGLYYDWVTLGESVDRVNVNPPNFLFPNTGVLLPIQPVFSVGTSNEYPYGFTLPQVPATGLDARGGLAGIQTNVGGLDPNLRAPRTVNYLMGVERELPNRTVLGLTYSGSYAWDGIVGTNFNRFAGDLLDGRLDRLNPSFGVMQYIVNSNVIRYNAMIASARKDLRERGVLQASYTLSRARDYYQGGSRSVGAGDIPDPSLLRAYRADSAFDARHRFSGSGVYRLPTPFSTNAFSKFILGGWELGVTAILQSGNPFWIVNQAPFNPIIENGRVVGLRPNSGDYNADGTNFDLPNVPAGIPRRFDRGLFLGANAGRPAMNADDFGIPELGTQGNSPRNAFVQQGVIQLNSSVLKNHPLGERTNLQLKFEFFNAINRVNLGGINTNVADFNFGRILGQNPNAGPRTIQVGARIAF